MLRKCNDQTKHIKQKHQLVILEVCLNVQLNQLIRWFCYCLYIEFMALITQTERGITSSHLIEQQYLNTFIKQHPCRSESECIAYSRNLIS